VKKLVILILGLLLSFLSCSPKKTDENNVYYVIKNGEEKLKPGELIPPPPLFYGQSNFILLDSTKIFYHDNYIFHWCGTGIDFTKPPRLLITPDSLVEVKMKDISSFLKKVIPDSIQNDKHYRVIISSPTDTIKNKAFETITNFLKAKKIEIHNIRNWTEEEKYVLNSKIENKKYYPSTVNWKIGFDYEAFVKPKKD
jgi:hypothetical protein